MLSAFEGTGCGLFAYKIYEEFHINQWECLMYGYYYIFPYVGLYNKTYIWRVYNAIRRKLKPG